MVYVHENNILNKINTNYNNAGDEIKKFYTNEYQQMRKELENINFSKDDDATFIEAAKIINGYYTKLDKFAKEYKITSQSKFRSSFLEELSLYLFQDNEYIKNGELSIYNSGIYAGMKIGNDLKVNIIDKDVDFCIGKMVSIKIDDKRYEIILPIIAVEVKTYLDATMFGEVQFSSRLLKNATPNVKTYVLMETNEVGIDKIVAARYDKILDEMFVLRFNKKTPIEYSVLKDYYDQMCYDIKNIAVERKISVPGRLIDNK